MPSPETLSNLCWTCYFTEQIHLKEGFLYFDLVLYYEFFFSKS